MFSNATEGDMFTRAWCADCSHAFEGNQLCDEAAPILFGEDPPDFLIRTPISSADPLGVTCTRFDGPVQ